MDVVSISSLIKIVPVRTVFSSCSLKLGLPKFRNLSLMSASCSFRHVSRKKHECRLLNISLQIIQK